MARSQAALPNILVAEDDPVQRKAVVGALEEITHDQIFQASDGREAQEILREHHVDIAITDLMMPHVGGLDLIAWGKEASPHTVWVILSSMDTFDNSVAAIRLGAFDFLAKPIDQKKLEASARSALRHQQLLSEKDRLDQQLRVALESSPSGAVMADEGGNIVLVNKAAERLFGFSREELIGEPAELLLADESGADLEPGTALRGAGNLRSLQRTLTGRRKNGTTFPVEIELNAVRLESGPGVIASVADTSQRDEIQRALGRSKGAGTAFVAAAVVAVLALAVGWLGIPRLQETNEQLAAVKNRDMALMLEVSAMYTLLLKQDGMFERAINNAQLWRSIPDTAEGADRARAERYLGQYNRFFDEYNTTSRRVDEHVDEALDAAAVSHDPSDPENAMYAGVREALLTIKRMHGYQAKRADSVFDLIDAGDVSGALDLAEEVGLEDKEIEDSVSDILREVQKTIEDSVAEAREVYQMSLNMVRLLAGVGVAALIGAALVGVWAARARRLVEMAP